MTQRTILWTLALVLAMLALGCGLTELMQATPTPASAEPTGAATGEPGTVAPAAATATQQAGASPTATPQATATPEPTATTQAAPTDTPQPTAEPGLAIVSFEVQLDDAGGGAKRLTCTWQTTGAARAHIVVGTSQRFPPSQDVGPSGTTTFDLQSSVYRDPAVYLTAYDADGNQVDANVTLNWPCQYAYFFEGGVPDLPAACPVDARYTAEGADQSFQNGAMIWIPGVEGRDVIFVLYNDQTWDEINDTWDESQPSEDPTIVPPAGLLQPVRGFGKAWRDTPGVRDKLGWATTPESSVIVTYQRQVSESLGGVQYFRSAGAGTIRLTGIGGSGSTWSAFP